jgi:hypothetical protein
LGAPCAIFATESIYPLNGYHYFSISSDKSSEELKNDVQILWGKIQRLLLSTERAFVAKTFVGISRASVSAIYPEVKHIRKMRVDFSSNCFIETDLISVYFENDDLIFSFKGISLVTNRIGDRFFEVKIDNDRFILKPTGRKGIKLDTSRRIKRDRYFGHKWNSGKWGHIQIRI